MKKIRRPFAQASYIQLGMCSDPYCLAIHMLLCDEDENGIAECLIDTETLEAHISNLRSVASHIDEKFRKGGTQ